MTAWHEAALISGMMIVTFGVRYPILALSGRIRMPPKLIDALQFVPVAVLSAITVPMMVSPKGTIWFAIDNAYLLAGVVSIAIAALSRHLLLTILLGMGLFLALRLLH